PEELDAQPVHLLETRRIGQKLIKPSRCRAAGQGDDEAATDGDRFARQADELLRRRSTDLLGIRDLTNLGSRHWLCLPWIGLLLGRRVQQFSQFLAELVGTKTVGRAVLFERKASQSGQRHELF